MISCFSQSKVGTKVLQEQRALADKASEDFERRAAKRRDEWEIEEQRAEAEAAKIRAAREEKDREWFHHRPLPRAAAALCRCCLCSVLLLLFRCPAASVELFELQQQWQCEQFQTVA